MKYYTLNLPFVRWWSNDTEDQPAEHIEEIALQLGINGVDVSDLAINIASPKIIYFYSNSYGVQENQYIKRVDDNNETFYYIYHSCDAVENESGETIYHITYVLDEGMSHELYRLRNNIVNGTEAWFENKHMERFISLGTDTAGYRGMVDYKQQPYLTAGNTSIQIKTQRLEQAVGININIDNEPVAFSCPFRTSGFDYTTDATYEGHIAQLEINTQNGEQAQAPDATVALSKKWRVKPLKAGKYIPITGDDLPANQELDSDGRVRREDNPAGAFGSDNYDFFGQQAGLKDSDYIKTWKDIDDFYNLATEEGQQRYRYAVYQLIDAEGQHRQSDSNDNLITADYLSSDGSTVIVNIPPNAGTFILLPCTDENGGKNVNFKTGRPGHLGNGTAKGTIYEGSKNIITQNIFESIIQNTYKVQKMGQNMETTVAPSQLGYMLEHGQPDSSGNINPSSGSQNPHNRITLNINGQTKTIGCMNLAPYGDGSHTLQAETTTSGTFMNERYGAVDYCPFFLASLADIVNLLNDVQLRGIKFFTDFKKMLDNAAITDGAPAVIPENEPLLKAPLYFNLKHIFQNDGNGTLYADMLRGDKLFSTDEYLATGHVNILTLPVDLNPGYAAIYRGDIETCVNPFFEGSPSREELIYTDNRQFASDAPSSFTNKESENNNAREGQAGAAISGMTQDAAESAYKAGTSIHDANTNATGAQKHAAAFDRRTREGKLKYEQTMTGAKRGQRNAIASAVTGAASFIMKNALSIPKIFGQRTNFVGQARSYNQQLYSADILLGGDTSKTNALGNKPIFATTYLNPYYADALFSYHAAYGYFINTNENMNTIDVREDFNYFKIDGGGNTQRLFVESNEGLHALTPYGRMREQAQEYIDRLNLGVRLHKNIAANNGMPWNNDEPTNIEIRLYSELVGDTSDGETPDNAQTRIFTVKVFDRKRRQEYTITESNIIISGLANDNTMTVNYLTNDTFSITGNPITEIYNIQPNYKMTGVRFSDDFNIKDMLGTTKILNFNDGSYLELWWNSNDEENLVYHSINGDSKNIWSKTSGGYMPSYTGGDGTKGDLDTKTLTFGNVKTVSSNTIIQNDYNGSAYTNTFGYDGIINILLNGIKVAENYVVIDKQLYEIPYYDAVIIGDKSKGIMEGIISEIIGDFTIGQESMPTME